MLPRSPCRGILLASLLLTFPAWAQNPFKLPGLGGGNENQPAVRLADDPRQEVLEARKVLAERQQSLLLHASDLENWKKRQADVRARMSELRALRATLVQPDPPTEAERRWEVDSIAVEPPPAPVEPDAGAPPPPDAGPDGGVRDGGAEDGGADGGTDGGVDAAEPLPPPEPSPIPPVDAPQPGSVVLLEPLKDPDGEGWLKPGVHPAEVREIDGLLDANAALVESLAAMQRAHTEERAHITAGINDADKLLADIVDDRKAETKVKKEEVAVKFGLKEVEQLGLARYRAEIDHSQAVARQRPPREGEVTEADLEGVRDLPDLKPIDALDLEPWAAYTESFQRAESLRGRQLQVRRELNERRLTLGTLRGPLQQSRARRLKLDLMLAERELTERTEEFQEALDALEIDDEVLDDAEGRFERSSELRKKNLPRLQEKLDQIRAREAAVGTQAGTFSKARLLEVQDMLVSERIDHEKLKLERDAFERDLTVQLESILDGAAPTEKFLGRYQHILDEERFRDARRNMQTRCDGWRRGRHEARREKAPPGFEGNRQKILNLYDDLADLCMRTGWVYGTQERFAEIARYHIEKRRKASRGFWWYAWRALLTLLVVALTLLVSRLIGRATRWLGGHDPEEGKKKAGKADKADEEDEKERSDQTPAPLGPTPASVTVLQRVTKMRGMAALWLFLGAVLALWTSATLFCANVVWDYPLELSSLIGWAKEPLFVLSDGGGVSAWSIVSIGIWTLCSIWVARLLQTFVSDLLEHFSVERGLRDTIGTIARYTLILIGIALGLASVGIGLGAFALVFGALAIGIGFGLQNITQNFISGFIILLERPIRKGDFIQVGDMVGEVRDISARATTIQTRDAISVIVPNAEFISNEVINWTQGQQERVRAQVNVGVAYGSDIQVCRRLLLQVARAHPLVLRWPPPKVQLTEFGESALVFVLHVWTTHIRELPDLISDLNIGVDAAFRAHDIVIPFPQTDLHIKEVPESARPAERHEGNGAPAEDEAPRDEAEPEPRRPG